MTTYTKKTSNLLSAIVAGSVIAGSFLLASSANANSYPLYLEDDLVKICEAIRDDNARDLRRAISDSGVRVKALHKGLLCNGEDMLTFADRHVAVNASELLARKLGVENRTLTAKR